MMDEHGFLIICLFYELRAKTQKYSVHISELSATAEILNSKKQDNMLYRKEGPIFLNRLTL
jgi:hypothetical protein